MANPTDWVERSVPVLVQLHLVDFLIFREKKRLAFAGKVPASRVRLVLYGVLLLSIEASHHVKDQNLLLLLLALAEKNNLSVTQRE